MYVKSKKTKKKSGKKKLKKKFVKRKWLLLPYMVLTQYTDAIHSAENISFNGQTVDVFFIFT